MRARDAIGRRIVGVRQHPVRNSGGTTIWDIDAIVLDNGVELRPLVNESEDGSCYYVELLVVKPKRATAELAFTTPDEQQERHRG